LIFLLGTIVSANVISQEIIDQVKQGVFEVVIDKLKDGPGITYDHEITDEELSYDQRMDPYHPIGSAFLIADNLFVSGGHVVDVSNDSLIKNYYIRDVNKKVYRVTRIIKYSEHKDLVVFEVDRDKREFKTPFKINKAARLNQQVYAVGNALGQGVVIRSGTLTSRTSESIKGEWKWYRFTAAASKGNSGGPLLDKSGRIIGIVLRKSKNENLNFALPIELVLSQNSEKAEVFRKKTLGFTNFGIFRVFKFKKSFPLPDTPAHLIDQFAAAYRVSCKWGYKGIFDKDKHLIPPYSDHSAKLFEQRIPSIFPVIIYKKGRTDPAIFALPAKKKTIDTPGEGQLTVGHLEGYDFFKFIKPINKTVTDFSGVSGAKSILDTVLLGVTYQRHYARDVYRYTSMGHPHVIKEYEDIHSRKWMIAIWDLHNIDHRLTLFYTLTPEGPVGFMTIAPASHAHTVTNMIYMADYMLINYRGRLSEWKDYLLNAPKPRSFIYFSVHETSKHLHFYTPLFDYKISKRHFSYSDQTRITYRMHARKTSDGFDFYPYELLIEQTPNNYEDILITHLKEPHYGEDKTKIWDTIVNRKYPYNEKLVKDKAFQYVSGIKSRHQNYYKFDLVESIEKEAAHTYGRRLQLIKGLRLKSPVVLSRLSKANYRLLDHITSANIDETFLDLKQSLKTSEDKTIPYYLMGFIQRRMNNFDLAHKYYQKSISENEDYPYAYRDIHDMLWHFDLGFKDIYEQQYQLLKKYHVRNIYVTEMTHRTAQIYLVKQDVARTQYLNKLVKYNFIDYPVHDLYEAELSYIKGKYKQSLAHLFDGVEKIKAHPNKDLFHNEYVAYLVTIAEVEASLRHQDSFYIYFERALKNNFDPLSIGPYSYERLSPYIQTDQTLQLIQKYYPNFDTHYFDRLIKH